MSDRTTAAKDQQCGDLNFFLGALRDDGTLETEKIRPYINILKRRLDQYCDDLVNGKVKEQSRLAMITIISVMLAELDELEDR